MEFSTYRSTESRGGESRSCVAPEQHFCPFRSERFSRLRGSAWLIFIVLLLAAGRQMEAAESGAGVYTFRAAFFNPHALVIDGKLDDPVWEEATPLTHFVLLETGAPAQAQTEVRVGYDKNHLYLAFCCHDDDVASLTGTQTLRDGPMSDEDHIEINLDTFHDRRTYFQFRVNVLGTRYDARAAGSSRGDPSFDCAWEAKTGKKDGAWVAEIAIPWTSLRFVAADGAEWGVNFQRVNRRNNERSQWAPTGTSTYDATRFGTMTGLNLKDVVARTTQYLSYVAPTFDFRGGSLKFNRGVDVSYPLGASMTAYFTLTPDFSNVESELIGIVLSDEEQRTAEKRPFFQEGMEIATMRRPNLFYTKRIGPIDAGVRLFGKMGRYDLYALNVQSSDPARPNHQVLRVIRDLGGGSSVSFMYAGKEASRATSRTFASDVRYNLPNRWRLLGSYGVARSTSVDGAPKAWSLGVWRSEFPMTLYLSWENYDPGFKDAADRDGSGFITLQDIRGPRWAFRHEWREPHPAIRRLSLGTEGSNGRNRSGAVVRRRREHAFKADLSSRFSVAVSSDRLFSRASGGSSRDLDLVGALLAYNVEQLSPGSRGDAYTLPTGAVLPAAALGKFRGRVKDGLPGEFTVGAVTFALTRSLRFQVGGERLRFREAGLSRNEFSLRSAFDWETGAGQRLVLSGRVEEGGRVNLYARYKKELGKGRVLYIVYGELESFDFNESRFVQTRETVNRLFIKLAVGM